MVTLLLPPLMVVLLPRMSGSSLVSVMVEPAIAFENVMVVPGLALAKVMASRSEGLALPFTVSALLVTVQDVPAHCASAAGAKATLAPASVKPASNAPALRRSPARAELTIATFRLPRARGSCGSERHALLSDIPPPRILSLTQHLRRPPVSPP